MHATSVTKTACYVLGTLFLLTTSAFLRPQPLLAWGCKGHQTVAFLAESQLKPQVREYVIRLLREHPVDSQLSRYCAGVESDLLADASTWADDFRKQANNGPWHYIDIPRGVPRQPLDAFCKSAGCITRSIEEERRVLQNREASSQQKAEALRYLIHFVADLHMPLHAADNNDEGGNCVPVKYFWRRPREHHHSYSPNLHSIWDVAIPERAMAGADPAEYADYLAERYQDKYSDWQKAGIHVDDWAWESHDIAEVVAYGGFSTKIPRETPTPTESCTDANNIGARMMALELSVGEAYQEAAARATEVRLALAGIRLAMILNEALGQPS